MSQTDQALLVDSSPDAVEIVAHEQALYDLLPKLEVADPNRVANLAERLNALPADRYATRADVARQLANEGHPAGFAELERLTSHQNDEARRWAGVRLGTLFGPLPDRLRPLLYRLAADPSDKVRNAPVQTLVSETLPDWEPTLLRALEQLAPDYDPRMLYWLTTRGSDPAMLGAIERLLRSTDSEPHLRDALVALLNLIKRDNGSMSSEARSLLEAHWDFFPFEWIARSQVPAHNLRNLPDDLYDRLVEASLALPDLTRDQRERLLDLRHRGIERGSLKGAEVLLASLLSRLDAQPYSLDLYSTLASLSDLHPELRPRIVAAFLDADESLPGLDGERPSYMFAPVARCLIRHGGVRARPLLSRAVDVLGVEQLRQLKWWKHDWNALDVIRDMRDRGLASDVPSFRTLEAAHNARYSWSKEDISLDDAALRSRWSTPNSAIDALRALGLLYYFDTEREAPPHYHELIEDITQTLVGCRMNVGARHQHFDWHYRQIRDQISISYHDRASVDLALVAEDCVVRVNIPDSGDWVSMEKLLATLNAIPKHLGWSERFACATAVGQDASIMFGDAQALNEVLNHFWLDASTYRDRDLWEARRAELRDALLTG